ncbi:MAG TPA: hypothetical protein VKC54_04110 [Patescibacteria group bacterium]|nr:hypothetical protein [Patescibacteria group bacterium]
MDNNKNQSGQALVMLLFFVIVGMIVATSATFIVATNSQAATTLGEGIIAKEMADSGIETAMLQILRTNDNYTGETININGGTVVITLSGATVKTIDSVATNGSFVKKVEVTVTYSNNVLGVPTSWKEVN